MTKDEALKMAIEALISMDYLGKTKSDSIYYRDEKFGDDDQLADVINACKEALEQPAQTYIVNNTAGTQFRLYEQPAQEPVAWINEDELPDEYPYDEMFKHSEIVYGVRVFPVYPPKHQWQGLTDDEIEEIIGEPIDVMYSGDYEAYRAIEQALKEKNHG